MDNSKFTFHLIHHSISQPINSPSSQSSTANSTATNGSSDETQTGTVNTTQTNANQTNDNELYEQKFYDISEQLTSSGHSQASIISNLNIESVVVSSQHLAFLLDNGRICRVSYQYNNTLNQPTETGLSQNLNSTSSRSVKHSKLSNLSATSTSNVINNSTINNTTSSSSSFRQSNSSRTLSSSSFVAAAAAAAVAAATNTASNASAGVNSSGSNIASTLSSSNVSNAILRANEAFIIPSPHDILSSSSLSHTFGRGRRNQLLRGRVSNLIVGSSRIPPFVPASAVPESLIESVQTVLQSKSRSIIIRELQRTNLDVNLAVNNLLQRDDEGDDPTDDEDPYMHGDDLISLLDINSHHGESVLLEADGALFDEDSFRLSRRLGSSRNHASTTNSNNNTASVLNNNTSSSDTAERDSRKSSYRIRDQRWYDSYRDELFSSNHHHHHRSINASSDQSNTTNTITDNQSKADDFSAKKTASSIMASTAPATVASKPTITQPSFTFGEQLQYWTDKNNEAIRFTKIASMHSELVAVSTDGRLHQWKWSAEAPFSLSISLNSTNFNDPQSLANQSVLINHPKTIFLQLLNEKICGLSTSTMRAACWTESGKIAAWMDETVDIPSTIKYQTPAQQFYQSTNNEPIIINDKILDMSTSNLFSIIRMASGAIYWWGIMPFEQRAKLIDKYHSKSQKSKSNNIANEITAGCYVSLKSLPLYNIGTVGITVKDGQPLIGQLNEHVFALRDCKSYKFKIKTAEYFKESNVNITEMPPPPSPSACPVDVPLQPVAQQQQQPLTGSLKRKKQYLPTDLSSSQLNDDKKTKLIELYDEESWNLNEVVLVEDSKSTILGKAIKVDNDYVLVKMQSKSTDINPQATTADSELLENSRIFPKNQLQLIKQSSSSKLPDFMQKTPKKLSDFGAVLSVTAQQNGFHAIISKENALFYIQFDLLSNKIVKEKRFTTSLSSFLGKNPNNISFFTQDDPNFNIMTLIDGNSTFYPLVELSGSNILKDPQWKNLFQVKCFSQSIISSGDNDTGNISPNVRPNRQPTNKKLQFVSFFAMRMEQLMTSIFRYDINRVTKILRQLETELIQNGGNLKRLKRVLNERCDGNRNILHAAVFICAPTTNTELNSNTTTAASNLRANKFSNVENSTFSDIYATYGTTPSSTFLSNSQIKQSVSNSIERPWSTSSSNVLKHDLSVRKINISIESMQQQPATNTTDSTKTTEQSDTAIPTSFWPPLPPTESKSNQQSQLWSPVKLTDKEKKQNALKILEELLQTPIFQFKPTSLSGSLQTELNFLCDLLSQKSADGLTPFMYAVSLRAYEAGLLILDTALTMRSNLTQSLLKTGNLNNLNHKRDLLFTNMIFPLGSRTDQSPLFVICSNDTCSFTWTGDNHITQDIFECRTCTLVGNLCCCTECARTCHKGHDCKIKTSSPTAYCDCWEKCKCKSLIAGDQEKRFKLLDKLLAETNLLSASSSRGESLLIYLVQTVGRQIQEQRNYKRHCGTSNITSSSRRNTTTTTTTSYCMDTTNTTNSGITGNIGDMPQHNLEPPKFCRRALERIFSDWYSIKQIFLFNNTRFQNDETDFSSESTNSSTSDEESAEYKTKTSKKKQTKKIREQMASSLYSNNSLLFDESAYVDAQSGCVDLDKFIYLLIMKCPNDILIMLVDTIQTNLTESKLKLNQDADLEDSLIVVKRFIRSVTRLMVILCVETSPTNLQLNLNLSTNSTAKASNLAVRNDPNITAKTAISNRLARFKNMTSGSTTNQSTIASLVTVSPIAKCEYILRQFSKYAVDELANAAHSLVAPVILGVTKPSTYKLSILSNNLSTTNNISFHNNTTNTNEFTSGIANSSSLADELFNLEPPIQRLFTTAISTTLIMPTPKSLQTMLSLNQTIKIENPQFLNTFESVQIATGNDSLLQMDETFSDSSNTAKNIQQDDDIHNTSMPPPLISNQDSSNQQLNLFVESDNNSNSSTASNKSNTSTNRARSVASSSKCSSTTAKQRHGATNQFSTRKSSGSSTSSGSSNNSNDSNHSTSSNSNSSSSSNSSDSSSDTNSNDTAITESSASTSNTKRSTIALKNGRSGDTSANLSNRRVAQVNFIDPFSLILLNSRNSTSSIDVNNGDDSASSTNQSVGRHRSRHPKRTPIDDFNSNSVPNDLSMPISSKIETSSVNSSSSLTTTVNDSNRPARSIASYFTDEDDDENDEDDEDEIDNDENSNDLSTTIDDEYDNEETNEVLDDAENTTRKINKRNKRKRLLSNLQTAIKKPDIKNEIKKSLNTTNREIDDEEEIDNEENDDEDDVEEDDDDENDVDEEEDEDEDGLDDYEIEHYNDDENMETSQDNDLTVVSDAQTKASNFEQNPKKKNKTCKVSYNIVSMTTKPKTDDKKAANVLSLSINSAQTESRRSQTNQSKQITLSTSALNTHNNTSNISSTQIATNPTTLYSPSSNYQRSNQSNSSTTRNILPNDSTNQRRNNSSSSINTIIQQYNNSHHSNIPTAHGYEQRINIINSINQPQSSPSITNSANSLTTSNQSNSTGTTLTASQPSTYQSGSNHHLSLGDYYYAAHNLVNLNNNNSAINNSSSTGSSSFGNLLNNNLLVESHRNHHHHHSTNIASNTIPTSNSSISGSVAQSELVSSFNTPSSVSLTNNTLARVFSILVKLIRDLLNTVYLEKTEQLKLKQKNKEKLNKKENKRVVLNKLNKLIKRINFKLDSPWQWLVSLMDSTESQLRFGASLSASQMSELSTSATQYLRHLEEKALLTNYFNNYGNSNQNNYGYYSSNNLVGGGPFISSRFGSGIDARRKLNIMQHQHQQFANLQSNQSYQHYNPSVYNANAPTSSTYYQQQSQQVTQSQPNQIGSGFGISRSANPASSSTSNTEILPNNSTSSSNAPNTSVASLASQFASSQIISTRKDFMSYALSLMRSQTNEHRDSLPSIDISLLKHVAYIFDGIFFYLKSNLSTTNQSLDINPFKSGLDESSDNESFSDDERNDDTDEFDLENKTRNYKRKCLRTKNNRDESIEDYYYFNEDDESEDEEQKMIKHGNKILASYYDDDDDDDDDDDSDEEYDEEELNFLPNQSDDEDKKNSTDLEENSIEAIKSDSETNEINLNKRKFNFTCKSADETSTKKKSEPKTSIQKPASRASSFFKRSNSTLCLGAESPDPFAYSLDESLPLAAKPHLLQPHSRIQDMFRIKSNNMSQFMSLKNIGLMSYNLRAKTPNLNGPFLLKKKHKRSSKANKDLDQNKSLAETTEESQASTSQIAKKQKKKTSNFLNKFEKRLFKLASLNDQSKEPSASHISKPNNLIDRWRLTVDLFGRVFCDDVGLETGSIIRQLGGFQLKEAKFRREMERLRNQASRELLMEVERDRDLLLHATFKSLNNMYNLQYNRRAAAAANMTGSSTTSSSNLLPPPLCLNRIKVTFKDEQGEGSGVARSFYTAFAEAALADIRLPSLDSCYYSSSISSNQSNSTSSVSYVPFNMLQRYRNSRASDQADLINSSHRRSGSNTSYSTIPLSTSSVMTRSSIRARDQLLLINSAVSYASSAANSLNETNESNSQQNQTQPTNLTTTNQETARTNTQNLSINAPAFFSPLIAITSSALNDLPNFDLSFYNSLDIQHREYGQQLYTKISALLAHNQQSSSSVNTFKAAKITGMLLELRSNQIQQLLSSESMLKSRFDEASQLLATNNSNVAPPETGINLAPAYNSQTNSFHFKTETPTVVDDSPLFWQPDKTMAGAGFYAPRPGLNTPTRLNAFRNVGRIMAICLLQNELCPITLSRHVIKYILNRPIKWHDLAFFDSQMYESFRKMISDAEKHLVNAIVNAKESSKVESKRKIRTALIVAINEVNEQIFKPLDLTFNIDLPKEEGGSNYDLLENGSKIEVNPINMYEYIKRYAEFRMVTHVEQCLKEIKSGIYDVLPLNALDGLTAEDFRLLLNGVADISIHTLASYTTISDESKETSRRPHFEKWFWATLEKMNQQEKQELLFFWTGSPYLPASEEGFQPLPTITLRPPSDQHLPTANTCINRLYLPMYSSKSILKSKILQAIKTKTFGFV